MAQNMPPGPLSIMEKKYLQATPHLSCILFFPTWKGVPGACFDPFSDTGNTPKEWFLSKKRPKEGERVARGHFHERVGESSGRYENFVTSGSPVAFIVSEIRPFENFWGPNQISLVYFRAS